MKTKLLLFLWALGPFGLSSQYNYEPSSENPYGLPNPEAPKELLDFSPLIGECNCLSYSRKADQTWAEPVDMIWRFKYIMNGMAVHDETLKADGAHSGSIRQFNQDSTKWYVHYYGSKSPINQLPTWEGNKTNEGNLVFYKEQKAPNGAEGFYRLSFFNIDENGYKWIGEWVDPSETVVFPTWKIDCVRTSSEVEMEEKEKILTVGLQFSKDYMAGNYEGMANAYTLDGKLFPENSDIIEGRDAIKQRWTLNNDSKIILHRMTTKNITILENQAYDYGYYEGTTQMSNGKLSKWKGKYVIIWKKVDGKWKMYLDIWNKL